MIKRKLHNMLSGNVHRKKKRLNKKERERAEFMKTNVGKWKIGLLRKYSKAENHFMDLLDKTPFFYVREKCCYDLNKGNWCYIDFYIPLFKLGIEIDGKEHRNKENHDKDLKKEKFLSEDRGISIYRITNEECLKMDSVDILKILREVRKNESDAEKQMRIKTEQRDEDFQLKEMQKRAKFDVHDEILAYCKLNDRIYRFKNLYVLKKSVMTDYKYLIRAINDKDNIYASNTFIFDFDETALQKKIERFYEYLWTHQKDEDDGL